MPRLNSPSLDHEGGLPYIGQLNCSGTRVMVRGNTVTYVPSFSCATPASQMRSDCQAVNRVPLGMAVLLALPAGGSLLARNPARSTPSLPLVWAGDGYVRDEHSTDLPNLQKRRPTSRF